VTAADGATAAEDRPWPVLPPGTAVVVVKLAPDGAEATRYPATVLGEPVPVPWLAVEARWVNRRVEMDGLVFEPGDTLREYFSPADRFNVFAVFAPDGRLRGWYANATQPTTVVVDAEPPRVVWHDLYLDVIGLPDGSVAVRDEDELAAAGVPDRDPALFAAISAARDEMLDRLSRRLFPFHDHGAAASPARHGSPRPDAVPTRRGDDRIPPV
jgi:hypothetical protein